MFELATLRNHLANSNFGIQQRHLAVSLIEQLNSEKTPFSALFEFALMQITALADKGDFGEAADLAQLIHNLPTWESINAWREEHFYRFELADYLDRADDPHRIKMVVILIADGQKKLDSFRQKRL